MSKLSGNPLWERLANLMKKCSYTRQLLMIVVPFDHPIFLAVWLRLDAIVNTDHPVLAFNSPHQWLCKKP